MNGNAAQPRDLADCVERLRAAVHDPRSLLHDLFTTGTPVYVARAPGRLDVMGGIGDYSGSLVLEMPIAEAALAAVQASSDGAVIVATVAEGATGEVRQVSLAARDWESLQRGDYESARQSLHANRDDSWAAYVLGPILVLLRETDAKLQSGLRILINSRVPEGKGVSSSAAVEVATMRAVAALAGVELNGETLARLCQMAENLVVGAPCGIMDQMTSALGRENQLLALRCQPAVVEGYVPIPPAIAFWGIDSGIRHAVSGSDYTSVRVGAFMGYRMIAAAAGLNTTPAGNASRLVAIDDPTWHGYLANITPAEFESRFESAVPLEISGREFLARYGGTTDRVTRVDPARTYAVRQPTLHPIGENERAGRFRELLWGDLNEQALRELGQLMFTAHDSYSACRIGSDGTDSLISLVREAGPERGLFGAKITGGGSGGTVAVLARANAGPAVEEIATRYTQMTGRPTYLFRGSSPGACATTVANVIL